MNFWRTNASMCDTSGNLLFYTNGIYIANRFDDTLFNGTNFNTGALSTTFTNDGLPIPQGVLIIPSPAAKGRYYIFSLSANAVTNSVQPTRLTCSYLDMTLDSGKGGLIWKNTTIINSILSSGQLTACKHGNGRDWWITVHQYKTGGIFRLLVTPQGISAPILQNAAQQTGDIDAIGQAIFSPDGKKYAVYDTYNSLQIFDFDRCTGTFTDISHVALYDSTGCSGAAFSPNSRYLYVSSQNYIFQYDTYAANILSSKDTVAIWDSTYIPAPPFATRFALMQLGPDNKIYINSCNEVNILHVINQPDSAGIACDVCQHCTVLPTYISFTIPNFPNYFLGSDSASICDTLQVGIKESNLSRNDSGFFIYPNPAQRVMHLKSQKLLEALIIRNLQGKPVLVQNFYSHDISLNIIHLDQGIYILECTFNNNTKEYRKIVIQR